MQAAVDFEMIGRSPCRNISMPPNKAAPKRTIEPHQIHALANEIGEHRRCAVFFGGVVGLRIGEVCGLQIRDFDPTKNTISISRTAIEITIEQARKYSLRKGRFLGATKTLASKRTLTLPRPLTNELIEHIERLKFVDEQDPLFQDSIGGALRQNNFRKREFVPAVKKLNLEGLTFHELRHSAATQWFKEGIDPKTVQHRLGHTDPRTTLGLYAKVSSDADAAAAETLTGVYWPQDDDDSAENNDV